MDHRTIRTAGDPVLRTVTDQVTTFDRQLALLVERMFDAMYAADGVCGAANQIGIGLSVFCRDHLERAVRRGALQSL